jgi:hypothetical protein
VNRRAFFAAVGSSAALPAVGDDPEVLAALRREEFKRMKIAEASRFLAEFGRNLAETMKGWYS